ncbi:MAG: hypothetical protein CMN77_04070 [Spirochaetaceae bacterium]|nr:hypothetical protein [Spirochaetaceae bacterium]|tara:strand:- start:13611 stop:14669 length:1059 start_codon:yes stop_codon:yes gene_type:complete
MPLIDCSPDTVQPYWYMHLRLPNIARKAGKQRHPGITRVMKKSERLFSILLVWILSLIAIQGVACNSGAEPAGKVFQFEVILDETLLQFCSRLDNQGGPGCDDFDSAAKARENSGLFMEIKPGDLPTNKRSIINFLRYEGHFIPGKHTVNLEADPLNQAGVILDYMVEESRRRLDSLESESSEQDARLSKLHRKEMMILASIVEKEAVSNQDYDRVASVFLNRLSTGQVLGSCPTVEYGLGYHRPFLLFKDLELQSDYNVYKRTGLPPGPVAQFSDEAYRAVLQPAKTEDVFFVYDWTTGKLHFAREYRDHKNNAARARSNFIQRYTKAPMYRRFDNLYYEDLPESEYPKGD